jgi:hypothetical protein
MRKTGPIASAVCFQLGTKSSSTAMDAELGRAVCRAILFEQEMNASEPISLALPTVELVCAVRSASSEARASSCDIIALACVRIACKLHLRKSVSIAACSPRDQTPSATSSTHSCRTRALATPSQALRALSSPPLSTPTVHSSSAPRVAPASLVCSSLLTQRHANNARDQARTAALCNSHSRFRSCYMRPAAA